MATVYKAFDTRLERDVALKVIRVDQFSPAALPRVLQRFEREAKIVARLFHPNIVKVLDYGEHEGAPYLVMEYVPGGTLKASLGRPVPWQEAVQRLIPIAEALAYAHAQKILHRDVKPSNILLTQTGQPMLTDFGVAKILENEQHGTLTATGAGMGTPAYMAPEQWTGPATAQSDIYSLGVVLYEMLTGRQPYVADTPAALLLKQANDSLPRPSKFAPGLPVPVERILLKALAKRPEDRYASMADFAGALSEVITPTVTSRKQPATKKPKVVAEPPRPKEIRPAASKPLRARWMLIAAGGIILIAAAVFGSRILNPHAAPDATPTATATAAPATAAIVIAGQPLPTASVSPTAAASPIPTLSPTRAKGPSSVNWGGTQAAWPEQTIKADTVGRLDVLASARIGGNYNILSEALFSPGSDVVAYGIGQDVHLVQVADSTAEQLLPGYEGSGVSLAFSPDGRLLASCQGGELKLWQLESTTLVRTWGKRSGMLGCAMEFSPDSTLLAASIIGAGRIDLWQVENGSLVRSIGEETAELADIAFSSDGSMIAASSKNTNKIHIWSSDGTLLQTLPGAQYDFAQTEFSRNGRLVASLDRAGTIWIWQLSDSSVLSKVRVDHPYQAFALSTDGSVLIVVNQSHEAIARLQAWRVSDGSLLSNTKLSGNAWTLALSPDGRGVLVGTKIWNWSNATGNSVSMYLYLLGVRP